MSGRLSKPPKRPRDLNQLAFQIVQEATGQSNPEAPAGPAKNPAAVALGALGAQKGGVARAQKLTAKRRQAIAKKAALARWAAKK